MFEEHLKRHTHLETHAKDSVPFGEEVIRRRDELVDQTEKKYHEVEAINTSIRFLRESQEKLLRELDELKEKERVNNKYVVHYMPKYDE